MLYASIALFAIAAIFGLTILLKWVSQKTASTTVIYSHGLFAVLGLVILIVYSIQNPDNFPKTSLILFGITAIGGLTMFFRNASNLGGKMGPIPLAFLHALLAVTSVVTLLLFVFAQTRIPMRFFRHPIDVMLVHFPIALFIMGFVFSLLETKREYQV